MSSQAEPAVHPIFDQLDIDLVVKVLAHTAFSTFMSVASIVGLVCSFGQGPTFIVLIAIFYWFHDSPWYDPKVAGPLAYSVALSSFCKCSIFFAMFN
jgi:hypothetical protein